MYSDHGCEDFKSSQDNERWLHEHQGANKWSNNVGSVSTKGISDQQSGLLGHGWAKLQWLVLTWRKLKTTQIVHTWPTVDRANVADHC